MTNYAKKHGVIYEHKGAELNVSLSYKQQLRAYSKKQFDPFCRRVRIVFPMPDPRPCPTPPTCTIDSKTLKTIDITFPKESHLPPNYAGGVVHNLITTTGQLSFFRWAITTGIIDYAVENRGDIEADMMESAKTRVKHTRLPSSVVKMRATAKAGSSSTSPPLKKTICKKNVRIIMSFN